MDRITIDHSVRSELIAHARREAPHECCGLLLGRGPLIDECVPVRNVSPSPATRYLIDPAEHIAIRRRVRGSGRDVIGCYHSHPASPATPSQIDIAEAYYAGFVWLIVSLLDPGRPDIAAYRLADSACTRLEVLTRNARTT